MKMHIRLCFLLPIFWNPVKICVLFRKKLDYCPDLLKQRGAHVLLVTRVHLDFSNTRPSSSFGKVNFDLETFLILWLMILRIEMNIKWAVKLFPIWFWFISHVLEGSPLLHMQMGWSAYVLSKRPLFIISKLMLRDERVEEGYHL